MKTITLLLAVFLWLTSHPIWSQQGLKGEYYVGTDFKRKILTRIDPKLSFDWSAGSPARGIPHSYYSVRWTGKLLAPVSGAYKFYATVDDGIRVWVDNELVMESWQLNDSNHYTGTITLKAGQLYDLRVDYFNDMMGGELQLFWQRPDKKTIYIDRFIRSGELIPAKYFFQKAMPEERFTLVRESNPPINVVPPAKVIPKSIKTIPQKRPTLTVKKPTPIPPIVKPIVPRDTTVSLETEFKRGSSAILNHVQFEQSSYILLPESSTELDKLVTVLKINPTWQIDIAGHTDNVGDPRLNLSLSENRAKVVSHYLTRHGIADDRITTKGYGGTRPIADNTIDRERPKNRRVEITIR
ncbi:PA14 domain-containing protein [Spirosoma harenae]